MKKQNKKKMEKIILKGVDFLEIIFLLFVFLTLANFIKNNNLGIAEVITFIYCLIRITSLYVKKIKRI